MAHTHDDTQETYYLDQLCSIALAGAFAGACITLYFWQTKILELMLVSKFHIFVLWGGWALLAVVIVRAIALWTAVGRTAAPGPNPTHTHDHARSGQRADARERVRRARPGVIRAVEQNVAAPAGRRRPHLVSRR